MPPRYVPDAGDIVWLRCTPQAGNEQAGLGPVLVISPAAYNSKTSLMLCCLMTTKIKGHPFEVHTGANRASAVLADQVKSLDWVERKAKFKGRAAAGELAAVRARIIALVAG